MFNRLFGAKDQRLPQTPEPAPIYVGMRNRILTLVPGDAGITPSPAMPNVWGVLMEMGTAKAVVTLVSLADGTTSLYFSNGGGIIGSGEHQPVAQASKELLAQAEAYYEKMMPGQDRHAHDVVNLRFAKADCLDCSVRIKCTHSTTQARQITVRPREQHEALQAAQLRQTTESFRKEYGKRAGIEGTISQAVRTSDLHRSRYVGLAKTHLQHVLTATATNISRVGAWLADTPMAATRKSAFATLATATG